MLSLSARTIVSNIAHASASCESHAMMGTATRIAALLLAAPFILQRGAACQGVTTGGVRGEVRGIRGQRIDALVRVANDATGFALEVKTADSRYLAAGLEPGGPYTITVRALGFRPQRQAGVYIRLGTVREFDFTVEPIRVALDTVVVRGASEADNGARAGTTINSAILDHLPAPNRDIFDYLRLVPELSTKNSLDKDAISAAGAGFRYNNFLIDGVSERTLSGSVSPAFGGNRSVPLAAVREYEIMLSPYDVRYGDFTGALVNAVTKSGTNTLQGSAFAYGQNERLARIESGDTRQSYEKLQYGLSLGGPIVRDRLHFFIAPELQRFTYPANGPFLGQADGSSTPVPVRTADVERFAEIMRGYGLTPGSAGAVRNGNPLKNLFTRLDLALPSWNSRLVVWNNYGSSQDAAFSRASPDTFSLSSYRVTGVAQTRLTAAHLYTALRRSGGGYNELLVSKSSDAATGIGDVSQPIVRVAVPSTSGGSVTLNSGTHESAQNIGGGAATGALRVKDNMVVPLGASHVVSVGADAEHFRVLRDATANALGTWNFASLDDFAAGRAERYDVGINFGDATSTVRGWQYAAYAGDEWQAARSLSLTMGARADLLAVDGHPVYDHDVDSIFGRRTDQLPRRRVELSPRLGFSWERSPVDRVYGGAGLFAGRYPLAWVQSAFVAYGTGNRLLSCNVLGTSLNYPPSFVATPAPTSCAGGAPVTPNSRGDVDLLDRNLRLLRSARASVAYERRLPLDLRFSTEGLLTRGLSDVGVRNLNLAAPRGADPYGRVMYDSIAPNGLARQTRRSDFSEVIDLINVPGPRAYSATTRLQRAPSDGFGGSLSYTYSHASDAQTLTRVNTRGTVLWASARVLSGLQDDYTRTVSSNDVPHRIIAIGTYAHHSRIGESAISFSWVGESGRPFTYIAYGAGGRGDLNGDGSNANDPIYVPRSALDTNELKMTGLSALPGADNSPAAVAQREAAQRASLEQFIERTPCLRQQRGRIAERNSCREPWSNTTIAAFRQELGVGARAFDVEVDLFNVLNLLNASWGWHEEALPTLLEQVQQTAAPVTSARPVFRYDSTRPVWSTVTEDSRFQLQFAIRYRF
jgi:hypothetical protein